MKVLFIDPRTDSRWETLLKRFRGDIFHSSLWMSVLTQTYGFDLGAFIALNDSDEPVGGIAFCTVKDFLGDRIVALPFSDYFDPFVENAEVWNALITPITTQGLPFSIRCLHNSIPRSDNRFVITKKANWQGLTLDADCNVTWNKFTDSLQRNIRRASRDNVTIKITAEVQDLRKFFQLHLGIRKNKYALLAQPYKFFENIWNIFQEAGKIHLFVARYDGRIISSALFLGWETTLYYKFGASDPFYLSHRPNDLLFWEAIKFGMARGYQHLDLGLSDLDQEGLIRFKRGFGSEEKEIAHLTYHPKCMNGDPLAAEKKKLLGNLTRLFTDASVPDEITAKGGELLYQYFT